MSFSKNDIKVETYDHKKESYIKGTIIPINQAKESK